MKTLYDIIGVDQTASDVEIKKAYRNRAMELHPDRDQTGISDAKFKELAIAYSILSDPAKREDYDQTGQYDTRASAAVEQARSQVILYFMEVLKSADIKHDDIYALVAEKVNARRAEFESANAGLEKEVRAFQEIIDRTETADGILIAVLNSKIEGQKQGIERNKVALKDIPVMLSIVEKYKYRVDPVEKPLFAEGTISFSTGDTGGIW